jgi:hypothetical protein
MRSETVHFGILDESEIWPLLEKAIEDCYLRMDEPKPVLSNNRRMLRLDELPLREIHVLGADSRNYLPEPYAKTSKHPTEALHQIIIVIDSLLVHKVTCPLVARGQMIWTTLPLNSETPTWDICCPRRLI